MHRISRSKLGKQFIQNYTPDTITVKRNGRDVRLPNPIKPYKAEIERQAKRAFTKPLDGPVSLYMTFAFPRPQNRIWKTKPMPKELHIKKPDLDNLAKAVMDALNGIAWGDDAQVNHIVMDKFTVQGGVEPYTTIVITPGGDA